MPYLEMFPQEVIALQEELTKHPELVKKLESAGLLESDISSKLATIATHCGILVDGLYSVDEVVRLCGILERKLRESRTVIILPH